MISSEKIKYYGYEMGITIRITTADFFKQEEERIKIQIGKGFFLDDDYWSNRDSARFCNPFSVLSDAKSIIGSFLFYLTPEEPDPTEPGKPFGIIAHYTRRNYYKELKNRLKKVAGILKREYRAESVVHSCGPIAEKPIARRSGIGYYGKHSIIINPDYGSWIVLGEIITDIEIEPDQPLDIDCGECHKCMDACPTGAIIEPYIIDRKRCIQNLTNWLGAIPDDIARVWENRLYGCTTCQEVCPLNKKVKPESPKTEIGVVGSYIPIIEILQMDEETYRKRYSDNQITARWINFDAIKRNALICLGNIKDKKTVPVIEKFTKDTNHILQKTAIWALEQF